MVGEAVSQDFAIKKGTKQGDPVSPILFNSVLEQVMRKVKLRWSEKKYGVQLGHVNSAIVTNLRFADDILLVGRSLPQIKRMLADVIDEGKKIGLELHPQKTKIQHNGIGYGSAVASVTVQGMIIEVLEPSRSTMYLGRAMSFTNAHSTELHHRLSKAWAKFGLFRNELTDRSVPLGLRLKLFQSILTPTVLYGCSSSVLTSAMEDKLRSTQMKMLRTILGRRRLITDGGLESWVDWVKRTTREARQALESHGVKDWVAVRLSQLQSWRKRLDGMPKQRWAKIAYEWSPEGTRRRGRPNTRWDEQVPS